MKYLQYVMMTMVLVFMATGCDDKSDDSIDSVEITTTDIDNVGQYFDLGTELFVDPYDVAFDDGYTIYLNGAAKVLTTVAEGVTFEAATLPGSGYEWDTTDSLAIGGGWYDYNPTTHAFAVRDNVYFIRTSGYNWVKLAVDSIDGSTYYIRHATMAADSSFGTAVSETVIGTASLKKLNLDDAGNTNADWQVGFVTSPIYAGPDVGYMYMPEIITNYGISVSFGIITGNAYDGLTSDNIADVTTWHTDAADVHKLGYGGSNEVLVYHPEPPYNHKVLVENPDYSYIIDDGSGVYYKLRFLDNTSGIILFEYASLAD